MTKIAPLYVDVKCTPQMHKLLRDLAESGLYGNGSIEDAARHLLETQLREVVKETDFVKLKMLMRGSAS